ncbi:hypothetical protein N9C35_05195 [Flavobacteriaceae bacterium]|nr:hypothetical protein [Flavobacteriaceae bacterium]
MAKSELNTSENISLKFINSERPSSKLSNLSIISASESDNDKLDEGSNSSDSALELKRPNSASKDKDKKTETDLLIAKNINELIIEGKIKEIAKIIEKNPDLIRGISKNSPAIMPQLLGNLSPKTLNHVIENDMIVKDKMPKSHANFITPERSKENWLRDILESKKEANNPNLANGTNDIKWADKIKNERSQIGSKSISICG